MAEGPKDFWDKAAVILHPMGGLLTAVAVTYVGMKGSRIIDRQQSRDTNARLYSELMSRREEAETSLRKDMFGTIITAFLDPKAANLDGKVLNLELLAYNFNDSLNLKPLFLDLARQIKDSKEPRRDEYLQRIALVAKETSQKQIFALEGHGKSFRRTIDLEELAKAGRAGIPLEGETIKTGGLRYDVNLRALSADAANQTLTVRLEVKAREGTTQSDTRATFEVSWFDFPMIDNIRLPNGQRCAVTLANFAGGVAADVATICFPAEFASIKDRPYYDEVIQKLRQAAKEQDGESGGSGK
jgi:hypothetical protein